MALSKSNTRWLMAAAVLLIFIVAMVVLDRTMTLDELSRWGLRIGFVLLGLIGAGAVAWFLRPQDAEPELDPGDDVLLAISGARSRLPRGGLAGRALVLVLGPAGSAKTSVVARSGGDPQLLAGDAPAAPTDAPAPTTTANVWLMQQAVLTELTAALLADGPRWSKVVRALRASRMAAAVGQGQAAPRAAVVCIPCDLFYAGNNGQQLATLAQSLRQRLAEAARELGLAVPIYVLFTKMDRVPHFEAWVSVFTKDELRAPLGATLPFDASSNTGNYAERLTPRIEAAFTQIADSLASRRAELLARESVESRRYGAYELPREVRKLQASVTALLLELCRPTQLGVSPLLRGFYFAGARPVLVRDVAAAPAAQSRSVASASDATQIFRDMSIAASAPAPAAAATSRKVPEWVFLDRFFRDVVLADGGANSVAHGGVSVQRTRRVLLGGAIAASTLVLGAVSVSWLSNRAMGARIAQAARDVAALPVVQSTPGTVAIPSVDGLRRLDVLRAQLDTLRTRVREGPPLFMRLGLWQGEELLDAARPVWYDGFRKQLFATGWGAMVDSLKALPEVPDAGSDYQRTYGWLKGYLVTTVSPERSTREFLTPVLLASWQRGQTTDADVTSLARRQFEFYASALPTFNPWPVSADASLVSRVRNFLSRFTGGEQIYVNMLGAANRKVPPLKLPQAPGVLTVPQEVAGAFTAPGAKLMVDAFKNSDEFFKGEMWVVGDATAMRSADRDSVIGALRARYRDDYVRAWRQVVQSIGVVRPSTVQDAASKLDALAGTQSPMLQVLRTIAVNTDVDSATRAAFQPVHAVTPPAIVDKYISEKNQPYVDGLLALQGTLKQIAGMPPPRDTITARDIAQAAQMAGGDVTRARVAAKRVAQAFELGSASAVVAAPLEQLLLAPISGVEAVLRTAASTRAPAPRPVAVAPAPAAAAPAGGGGGGAAALATILNERGRALCAAMTPMLAKFPFAPDAQSEASIAEVSAMLAPGTGALWAFRQERLDPLLEKQGTRWSAKPSGGVALSASFVEFFNRAAVVSAALFPNDIASPQLRWMARGITSDQTPLIVLKHSGTEARFDSRTPRNEVIWPSTSGRDARLEAQFKKNKPVAVATATGEWALFRMVAQAAKFDGAGRVEWNATGKDARPVVVEFDLPSGAPVLKRGWLGGMTCVAQVTQ